MKKGRLTQNDKYVIQGMYGDNKTTEEIAEATDRSVKSVTNYIEKELDEVVGHVVQASIDKYEKDNDDLKKQVEKLQAKKDGKDPNKFQSHIIQETNAGRKGVTIMTETGSQRGDLARSSNKRNRCRNRSERCKNRIYNIKDGKMED